MVLGSMFLRAIFRDDENSEMRLNKGTERQSHTILSFCICYVKYQVWLCYNNLIVWFDLEIGINPVSNSIFFNNKNEDWKVVNNWAQLFISQRNWLNSWEFNYGKVNNFYSSSL